MMDVTPAMLEAALDAWCRNASWRNAGHRALITKDMRAAIEAALEKGKDDEP